MARFAAAIAVAVSLVGARASAQQILLLDFWSPQCGPCMQMKPIVHSLEQARYPIRQIDTTRDSQTSQQFNVTSIPCFVMLVNGRETERQVGGTSSESLQQMFQRAKDLVAQQQGMRFKDPEGAAPQNSPMARGPAVDAGTPPSLRDQPGQPGNGAPAGRSVPDSNNIVTGPLTPQQASLMSATVRLYVEDPQGRSCGTGTIIDTRSGEALVVTCGHLFRETQGKAPVKAELFEPTENGVRVVGQATGKVISFDLKRDVALVSIRLDRSVKVAAVAPPKSPIDRGDRVMSIGCSNGNDPTIMESRVTSLDRYQGPPNIEASGAPAIGRSGGGLFNTKGELVGICNNADPEGNEGLYAGLQSIHEELDRVGLKDIYANADVAPLPAGTPASAVATSGPTIVRGQEAPPITPLPSDAATKAGPQRNLSPTEQAGLEEIMKRAVNSEVVCIIRPKDAGGQSEIITLDNMSPEFIRALAELKRNGQAPATR